MGEEDDIRDALRRDDLDAVCAAIYATYGNVMFDRALKVLRDRGLAKDAVQITMMKTMRSAGRLRGVRSLRGWLLRATTNTAVDMWREARRRRARTERLHQEAQATAGTTVTGAGDWPDDHEHTALSMCLGELDADTRAAFLRRRLDDASWEEVASELDMEVDAARMRVKRAMKRLKECLERQGVER